MRGRKRSSDSGASRAAEKRRGARCSRSERPGEESYFLPIATVAVPAGEAHPAEDVSVTESVTEPFDPAVYVIEAVPCPDVIEPLEMLQP